MTVSVACALCRTHDFCGAAWIYGAQQIRRRRNSGPHRPSSCCHCTALSDALAPRPACPVKAEDQIRVNLARSTKRRGRAVVPNACVGPSGLCRLCREAAGKERSSSFDSSRLRRLPAAAVTAWGRASRRGLAWPHFPTASGRHAARSAKDGKKGLI